MTANWLAKRYMDNLKNNLGSTLEIKKALPGSTLEVHKGERKL